MLTTLKIRRLWQLGRYRALIRELTAGRPEGRLGLDETVGGPVVAAAVGLVRLRELNQTGGVAEEMRQRLLWTQTRDGSWGEAGDTDDNWFIKTALAVRALHGLDAAAAGGLAFLRRRQGRAGWGSASATTAVVLLEAGRLPDAEFRLADAMLEEPTTGVSEPDAVTRWAWKHAKLRCGRLVKAQRPQRLAVIADEPTLAFAA